MCTWRDESGDAGCFAQIERAVPELIRLLACPHASPVSVVGGEFTAAFRAENERFYGEVTLSVDIRASLIPGVHACLDMRLEVVGREGRELDHTGKYPE